MKALLLSAYDASSHRAWHSHLTQHLTSFSWQTLCLPARHFPWRSRSNSVEFALKLQGHSFDLLLATSPTDLSALLGLAPSLSTAHKVLYMHENQFSYPTSTSQKKNHNTLHLQLLNLYSALAADLVLFNSSHNLNSFLQGTTSLLQAMPDGPTSKEVLAWLEPKCDILPVGIEADFEPDPTPRQNDAPCRILWPHRWEYDKAPERFFSALSLLQEKHPNLLLELHVVGESFRHQPPCFELAKTTLSPIIKTWGYLKSKADYITLLKQCDIVVSSALHEFQGLAMLEAIASGCTPVAPDRLAYLDYVPKHLRYSSTPSDPQQEALALAALLEAICLDPTKRLSRANAHALAAPYRWDILLPQYLTHLTPTHKDHP